MSDIKEVFGNDMYFIQVGTSIHAEVLEVDTYQVVNRRTSVVEVESTALPTAIEYANAFNNDLKTLLPEERKTIEFKH